MRCKSFEDFITTELAEGNSFFIFMNENPHALSSCCRLKNNISDTINDFSYTLGAGGVSTGSVKVITLNINRIIQKKLDLLTEVKKVQQYHVAYRHLFDHYKENKMLPIYDENFISFNRQYSTIGINGLVEATEYLGYQISPYDNNYINFVQETLKTIYNANIDAKKEYGFNFNTEFVPAENLGVKNTKWDKEDGLKAIRDCCNSYLYCSEDKDCSIIDKFIFHGKKLTQYLDGGSALHCNLNDYPTKETFKKLLDIAAQEGCDYFCFKIKVTVCQTCHFINKRTLQTCSKCQSHDIVHATRIIGYLQTIDKFSQQRHLERSTRQYHNNDLRSRGLKIHKKVA